MTETKNYFTPFIFDPVRIDMNNIVHSLSTRTDPYTFPVEHFSNNNNNNELYNYIIYIYNNEEKKKSGVGNLQEKCR